MKRYNIILFLTAIIAFTSCSNSESHTDSSDQVDYLINGQEFESLGLDYGEKELSLYKNDPDKIYFTTVGSTIHFEDITVPELKEESEWYLDSESFQTQKVIAQNKESFDYSFDTPGIYRVSLKNGSLGSVTKFIRVLDDSSSENTSTNDLGTTGDIGYFKVFDFAISNPKPAKWEAIVLEDISETENEITNRLWDFGDGTVIPTKGKKVKYSYDKIGVYEVKLCVNMTNNCKRKRIIVSNEAQAPSIIAENLIEEKEDELLAEANFSGPKTTESAPSTRQRNQNVYNQTSSEITSVSTIETKSTESNSAAEVVLQNVSFDMPNEMQAGLPVRMKDQSFPDEAIRSRSWFIDGEKQFFHQRTINYIFDSPGTYTIKMCLNKKADLCMSKTINVYQQQVVEEVVAEEEVVVPEERLPVIEYIPIPPKTSKGFMCQTYGKAGLKSKYKCTTDKNYHYGNAIINIVPHKTLELQNAEIYGENDGYMDVFLLDDKFVEIGRIKNVQVLPGYSTVEFADLAFTLEKGKSYSILLKPKSFKGERIGLESASACKVPIYSNDDMTVDYQGKAFVMYDIKYCL